MSIDLKTTSVEPTRRTFDHLAEKLGPNKNPTRYQEATWGLQPQLNFHYRPTWDPSHELYDRRRTQIVMADFDDLVDPRQYYYGTWTIQRGKQQDSQEKNFTLVEQRELLGGVDAAWLTRLAQFIVPVRHIAWAANTNNSAISAYGFGAPVTSGCAMHMMDQLGVAQYISRIGLLLADNQATVLDQAKREWLDEPRWQGLRQLVEDSMVTEDWFELFVLQNFLIDSAVFSVVVEHFGNAIIANGGAAYPMLVEFIADWHDESTRWVDAVIKRAVGESDANCEAVNGWVQTWLPRVKAAVEPWLAHTFEAEANAVSEAVFSALGQRAGKIGINI